jgi:hypothetical protein
MPCSDSGGLCNLPKAHSGPLTSPQTQIFCAAQYHVGLATATANACKTGLRSPKPTLSGPKKALAAP